MGYKTNNICDISTDIHNLEYELKILKHNHYVEQHFTYYKSVCELFNMPIPSKENILKIYLEPTNFMNIIKIKIDFVGRSK